MTSNMTSSIVSLPVSSSWMPSMMAVGIFLWFRLPYHYEPVIFQLLDFLFVELSRLVRIFVASICILIVMNLLFGVFSKLVSCSLMIFLLGIRSLDPVEFYIMSGVSITPPIFLLFQFFRAFEGTLFVWFPVFRLLGILIIFRMHNYLWFLPWFILSSF